jgi:hypothetical protein
MLSAGLPIVATPLLFKQKWLNSYEQRSKEEESTQGDIVEEVPGNTALVEETPHDES